MQNGGNFVSPSIYQIVPLLNDTWGAETVGVLISGVFGLLQVYTLSALKPRQNDVNFFIPPQGYSVTRDDALSYPLVFFSSKSRFFCCYNCILKILEGLIK